MAQEHEDVARDRQLEVLRVLEARLAEGDGSLPTDVFGPMERELELRIDREAVDAAWAEHGDEVTAPGVSFRGRIPREVTLLSRAARDLARLRGAEWDEVVSALGRLGVDPLPRGAAPLEGHAPKHLCCRVGRVRVLYRMVGAEVAIVALTGAIGG